MTVAPIIPFFTRLQPTKLAGHLDLVLQTANSVLAVVIKFKVDQEIPFYHIILPSVMILQLQFEFKLSQKNYCIFIIQRFLFYPCFR